MTDVNGAEPVSPEPIHLREVDRNSGILLHEQVAASIRRAISEGEALPGERIPHARDLAAVLGVNTNTVLRAIRLLRDEGLLEAGRGKAITVTGTPERGVLTMRIRELIELATSLGYRRDEVAALIRAHPESQPRWDD